MTTREVWEFIFKNQIEEGRPIKTVEMPNKTRNQPLFGEYSDGQIVLFIFTNYEYEKNEQGEIIGINSNMFPISYPSGLDQFMREYCFDRMGTKDIPICIAKNS